MAEEGEQRLVGYCCDCEYWCVKRINFCRLIGAHIPDLVGNGECRFWVQRETEEDALCSRLPDDGKRFRLYRLHEDWIEAVQGFANET